MMVRDMSFYEDVQGQLRGLLTTLEDRLSSDQASLLTELIDANECGVALEMMTEILVEAADPVPDTELVEIKRLGDEMEMPAVVKAANELNGQ